jgi:hypothetical protein
MTRMVLSTMQATQKLLKHFFIFLFKENVWEGVHNVSGVPALERLQDSPGVQYKYLPGIHGYT